MFLWALGSSHHHITHLQPQSKGCSLTRAKFYAQIAATTTEQVQICPRWRANRSDRQRFSPCCGWQTSAQLGGSSGCRAELGTSTQSPSWPGRDAPRRRWLHIWGVQTPRISASGSRVGWQQTLCVKDSIHLWNQRDIS